MVIIRSFQLSLHWDPAFASFVGVEQFGVAGLAAAGFATNLADSGTLTVSWADPGSVGVTVPEGTTVFAVRLQLRAAPGTAGSLSIDGTPAAMEASIGNAVLVPVTTVPGLLTIAVQPPAVFQVFV